MRFTRITIIRERRPSSGNLNEGLQWLGGSLGLFGLRDKDKSCFRIFITLLKVLKKGVGLSSDDLAATLKLSRGTVVHHLNRLMEAGIVTSERNKYYLVVENLSTLVDEIKSNVDKALTDLRDVAKEIDEALEL
jgi:predicted transcriptional regulator